MSGGIESGRTSWPSAVELLREWVAIPSVNPSFSTSPEWTGEARMAESLAARLTALGGRVVLEPVFPGRPNVVARFAPPRPIRRTILLAPHLDTVGVEGMTVEPFAGAIREGRIYGRGACDTKGPMAAAVSALGRWVQSPGWAESETEWVFAATIGEEDRGAGALALCRDGLRADFAIALEPTDLRVIHGLKGKLRVGITVRGRACHAAHAEEGINAIYRAVPVLRVCERLAAEWTVRRHPLLGSAVLNLGLISGGTGLNIVPDRCEMGLDIRTHPDFTHTDAIRELEREVGREAPGAECIVLMAGPPMLTESRNPLVRDLAALGAGLGVESWFSDANTFSAAGIPSVAFGPGSISQAHTADEWISIDELNQGAEILFRFMSGRG